MTDVIAVHGPAACGKTRNADALARRFGAARVIDGWEPHSHSAAGLGQLPGKTLLLTNASPAEIRAAVPAARIVAFSKELVRSC